MTFRSQPRQPVKPDVDVRLVDVPVGVDIVVECPGVGFQVIGTLSNDGRLYLHALSVTTAKMLGLAREPLGGGCITVAL